MRDGQIIDKIAVSKQDAKNSYTYFNSNAIVLSNEQIQVKHLSEGTAGKLNSMLTKGKIPTDVYTRIK